MLFGGIVIRNGFPQTPQAQVVTTSIPFICPYCLLDDAAGFQDRLRREDITNAFLYGATLHADFSNTIFRKATLLNTDVIGTFTNAKFNKANISGQWINSNFTNANFTNATILLRNPGNDNFTNADFTNANLTGTNFISGGGNDFTGAVWSNTICPDGTNSNNNGNTCIGHLTP